MAAKNKGSGINRVLFTTDFTEASVKAVSYALSTARKYGAKLYVLHVVDVSGEPSGFYVPHISYERLEEEMAESAKEMMERFCSRHLKGFKNLETDILVGEPYKEILKFVKGARIDMIVMGMSGKPGIDRFLFGSTTERVMRKAECPILVIPPSR